MAQSEQQVDLLLRRRIEAQVLLPLIRAFEKRLGREETRKIVSYALKEISGKDGNAKAESLEGNSLEDLAAGVIPMRQGLGFSRRVQPRTGAPAGPDAGSRKQGLQFLLQEKAHPVVS